MNMHFGARYPRPRTRENPHKHWEFLGSYTPTAAGLKARIRLQASSSESKSFATHQRNIRLPVSDSQNAVPGTEATPPWSLTTPAHPTQPLLPSATPATLS